MFFLNIISYGELNSILFICVFLIPLCYTLEEATGVIKESVDKRKDVKGVVGGY